MADKLHFLTTISKILFGIDVTNNSDSQHLMYLTGIKRVFNTDT